ncbi:SWIM zinc finger family protein [Myxococcus landrumensis]|uniref:SWIM zinc finger family protein n=1 Tax=Myxococcus landrumensis TaxID=2813577 RepID=A0ABX7N622_9BACT|nr:SWIM zinc finger family protein [Myxococcus landrumus]QSQ13120.1 SWIM zinc finger family protein [Myxococcus landrumus]
MTALSHTYQYGAPSELVTDGRGQALRLMTSGGGTPRPFFFEGRLLQPRPTALALRALSRVVGTRFHIPPAMLHRILMAADPVVTCGRGMLRFEGFSGCASTYARVDLTPSAYEGDVASFGTTNVDFNAPMRAALATVRTDEPLALSVGHAEVVLERGESRVVERKVPLPLRWLKGFAEVQAYLARLEPFAELSATEALRFLRGLPRARTDKRPHFLVPQGRSVRLSATPSAGAMRLTGMERLRVLEDLAPFAKGLVLHADPRGQASAFVMDLGSQRFTLALSSEVWRGFSGEGQTLTALAQRPAVDQLLSSLRAELHWESVLETASLAGKLSSSEDLVWHGLQVLGVRGLVGFDSQARAFFHRELPFDFEQVEALAPRLADARALLEAGALEADATAPGAYWVRSTSATYHVRLDEGCSPVSCGCTWFAKHGLERGPCKHLLAAHLHATLAEDPDTP